MHIESVLVRCALVLSVFVGTTCAAEINLDPPAAIFRAHELNLSQDPYWLRLLHYAPHELGLSFKSEIDDPRFFLSQNGKYDPLAELDASIQKIFFPKDGNMEIRCRFIARKRWLENKLGFPVSEESCSEFHKWDEALNAERLTLIFPAAYLNNPASMFGHTFLRIDPKGQVRSERLLSYGVNYAADTVDSPGLFYAIKGIFGGYPGYFSILPYYMQVKEYSDLESRDIWEYELSLTEEEIERMITHLWELQGISFDYYFFDENCSYHLLSLLEVARPDLDLRKQFHGWVIPTDTVRSVVGTEGLLERVEYRPSNRIIVKDQVAKLSEREKEKVLELVHSHLPPEIESLNLLQSEEERARVLDAAGDYATYLSFARPKKEEHYTKLAHQLSLLRSRVPVSSPAPLYPAPPEPTSGHATMRMSLASGVSHNHMYGQFEIRPAYHDLMDPEPGYIPGAELQFLNLALRVTEEKAQFEKFDLLKIISLGTRDDFFSPISWTVSTGLEQLRIIDREDNLAAYGHVGGGFAYNLGSRVLLALLAGPSLELSDAFEEKAAIGVGPQALAIADLSDNLRCKLSADTTEYLWKDNWLSTKLQAELRYTLEKNTTVGLSFLRNMNGAGDDQFTANTTELQLALRYFFR